MATASSTSPNGSSPTTTTGKQQQLSPLSGPAKSLHNVEASSNVAKSSSAPPPTSNAKLPLQQAAAASGNATTLNRQQPQQQQQQQSQSPTLPSATGDSNFKFDFYGSTPSMSNLSFGSFGSLPSLSSMPPHPSSMDRGDVNGGGLPSTDTGRLVAAPSAQQQQPGAGRPQGAPQPAQQQAPPRGGAPAQQSRGGPAQGRPSGGNGGSQNLAPLQPHPAAPSSASMPQQPQQAGGQPQGSPPSPGASSSTAVVPASPGQSDRRVINPVTVPNGQNFVDITEYLNMPQSEAAKKLSIPPSTLSKRWKEAVRNRKWPWRVVCKLDKEIMTLLHNVPQGAPIPEEIEGRLGYLMRKRQEELKPVVIRL